MTKEQVAGLKFFAGVVNGAIFSSVIWLGFIVALLIVFY